MQKFSNSREDYDNKLQYTSDDKSNVQKSQQLPILTESNMIKSTILKSSFLSVSCLISSLLLPPITAALADDNIFIQESTDVTKDMEFDPQAASKFAGHNLLM
jgi:hypothetical protein